jgi:hypothetical protein
VTTHATNMRAYMATLRRPTARDAARFLIAARFSNVGPGKWRHADGTKADVLPHNTHFSK